MMPRPPPLENPAGRAWHKTDLPGGGVFNYFQPLHREVKGILLYQEFPRPISSTKHLEHSKGCFVD